MVWRTLKQGREPGTVSSFSESYTASLLRMPQLVVPGEPKLIQPKGALAYNLSVGQVPYSSRATGQ